MEQRESASSRPTNTSASGAILSPKEVMDWSLCWFQHSSDERGLALHPAEALALASLTTEASSAMGGSKEVVFGYAVANCLAINNTILRRDLEDIVISAADGYRRHEKELCFLAPLVIGLQISPSPTVYKQGLPKLFLKCAAMMGRGIDVKSLRYDDRLELTLSCVRYGAADVLESYFPRPDAKFESGKTDSDPTIWMVKPLELSSKGRNIEDRLMFSHLLHLLTTDPTVARFLHLGNRQWEEALQGIIRLGRPECCTEVLSRMDVLTPKSVYNSAEKWRDLFCCSLRRREFAPKICTELLDRLELEIHQELVHPFKSLIDFFKTFNLELSAVAINADSGPALAYLRGVGLELQEQLVFYAARQNKVCALVELTNGGKQFLDSGFKTWALSEASALSQAVDGRALDAVAYILSIRPELAWTVEVRYPTIGLAAVLGSVPIVLLFLNAIYPIADVLGDSYGQTSVEGEGMPYMGSKQLDSYVALIWNSEAGPDLYRRFLQNIASAQIATTPSAGQQSIQLLLLFIQFAPLAAEAVVCAPYAAEDPDLSTHPQLSQISHLLNLTATAIHFRIFSLYEAIVRYGLPWSQMNDCKNRLMDRDAVEWTRRIREKLYFRRTFVVEPEPNPITDGGGNVSLSPIAMNKTPPLKKAAVKAAKKKSIGAIPLAVHMAPEKVEDS